MANTDLANHLEKLLESADEFAKRFPYSTDSVHQVVESRILIIREELDELQQELMINDEVEIANAVVDVFYAAAITMLRMDTTLAIEAIDTVTAKNNRKTAATHSLNEQGKVVRKTPLPSASNEGR